MGTPLVGTVIITGGNGSLGSEIAVAIAKSQPFVHLLLTTRDIKCDSVRDLIDRVRLIGPRSLEVARVDLASFHSVTSFCENTVNRVRHREIPPVIVLINSAATSSYVKNEVTRDGYDPVYQTNCIAPFLLTVSLLEGFRASNGTANGGARVINIGCSAMLNGSLDHFENAYDDPTQATGTPMNAREGNIRYGSSKLLMSAAMYGLRRSLLVGGDIAINISTVDPGGMAGKSRLRTSVPFSVKTAQQARSGLRPILRMFTRSAINKASIPAKNIARIAFQTETAKDWRTERYYILDSQYEAGSVIPVLRDPQNLNELLMRMMRQVEVGVKGMGTPDSRISRTIIGI